MDKLKTSEKTFRSRILKCHEQFDQICSQPVLDVDVLTGTWNTIKRYQLKLDSLNSQIQELMIDASVAQDDLDKDMEEAEKILVATETRRAQFDSKVKSSNPDPNGQGMSSSSKKLMLEKIVCKKFSGDLCEWISWWSQFEQVHLDKQLSDVQKFHYLSQAMVPNSPPSLLVEGFPQSAANYAKAIQELKHRFGRPELLAEHYVREFIKLTVARISSSDKSKFTLSSLYADVVAKDEAVKSMKLSAESYLNVLKTALIESCLPVENLRAWQRKAKDSTKSSYDQLLEFLRGEVDSEQKISLAQQRFGALDVTDSRKERKRRSENYESPEELPTAAGLVSHTETIQDCIFCQGQALIKRVS